MFEERNRPCHPVAQAFALLDGAAFEGLVQDITLQGLLDPITVMPDGSILDGRSRHRACLRAGVAPHFVTYTGTDPVAYVVSKNLQRRHLNESQRGLVAARLATMAQGARTDLQPCAHLRKVISQPEAAAMLNVSRRTVQYAHIVLDRGIPALVQAVEQGRIAVSTAAEIAETDPETQQRLWQQVPHDEAEGRLPISQVRATLAPSLPTKPATPLPVSAQEDYDGDEWYTPAEYITAARAVLGAIDLDPASCPAAQACVQATAYYTKADNGLAQPWRGRVWLNPPCSSPLIDQFIARVICTHDEGMICAALVLVNNSTGVWRILRMIQIEHKRISMYASSANPQRTPERISPCSSSLYSIRPPSWPLCVVCTCG